MRFDDHEVYPYSACCSSKRKCDMRSPVCTRCDKNGIICMYKKPADVTKEVAAFEKEELSINGLEQEFGTLVSHINDDSFRIAPLDSNDDYIFNFAVKGGDNKHNTNSLVHVPSSFEAVTAGMRNLTKVEYSSVPADQDLALYVERIRQYPNMFLRKLSTPFIHPKLYPNGIPSVLNKALAVCALYHSINESNFTQSYAAINQLIGEFTEQTVTIHDKLAAAQAMLLAQAIRYFGGVIRQQSIADKDSRLMVLLDSLRSYCNEHKETPTTFHDWILMDSIGRTFFLGYLCEAMYWVQRNDKHFEPCACEAIGMSCSKVMWEEANEHNWKSMFRQYKGYFLKAEEAGLLMNRQEDANNLDFEALLLLAVNSNVESINKSFDIDLRTRSEFLEFL